MDGQVSSVPDIVNEVLASSSGELIKIDLIKALTLERRFLTGLQLGLFFLKGGGGYTHSGYHKTLSATIACDRTSCETET